MKKYLQLLKDFRDAFKAGEWKKAWAIAIQIQQEILDLFGPAALDAVTPEERQEYQELCAEVQTLLETTTHPEAIGDGRIVAWLIKIGLIVIGIPLPFGTDAK